MDHPAPNPARDDPTRTQHSEAVAGTHRTPDPRPTLPEDSRASLPPARFTLRGLLGRGGMGVVWKAYDALLRREVALKMCPAGAAASLRARFEREARAAGSLRHPNVVAVHDITTSDDGQPFLVMELLPGGTLADRRGEFSDPVAAARLLAALASAAGAAHAAGVVHRDIKPGNVLFDVDNVPRLGDFGLAALTGDASLTRTGQVMGTPAYMSPEQAAGRDADPRSDVWSLGVVLFELLAGVRPFAGENGLAVMAAVRHGELPPLPANLPTGLANICRKCLAKTPASRYRDGTDLADDLRRYLNGERIQARPPGRLARAWRQAGRWRGAALGLGLVLAVAGIGAAVFSPRRPESFADRVLMPEPVLAADIDNRLAKDKGSWQLITGDGGRLRWWQPREGLPDNFDPRFSAGSPLRVSSENYAMLDLTPRLSVTEYELAGEVRLDPPDSEGAAGFYFAAKDHETTSGVFRTALLVRIHTARSGPKIVLSHYRRFVGDLANSDANDFYDTFAAQPNPSPEHGWCEIRARVSPESVRVEMGGQVTHELSRARREQILSRFGQMQASPLSPARELMTDGAIGLYVFGTSARFRNVELSPLSQP